MSDRPSARAWQYQRRETCWWRGCRANASHDQDGRFKGTYCDKHLERLWADAERISGAEGVEA